METNSFITDMREEKRQGMNLTLTNRYMYWNLLLEDRGGTLGTKAQLHANYWPMV